MNTPKSKSVTTHGNFRRRQRRNNTSGQSVLALVMVGGLIIIPLLAMFTFEVGRLYLAKIELQNATDAAALTAAATVAGSDNLDPVGAHNNSMLAALKIFQQNSVLGQPLTNTSMVDSATALTPAVGQSLLYFEFLDPITAQVLPISSPNGKVMRIHSSTAAPLAFGKFLGINQLAVDAVADGAVPKLDVVLCFDVSGSMDDQTPVTLVRRKWDTTMHGGSITYDVPNAAGGLASGKIFDIMKPPPTGTSLNGAQPQFLAQSYMGNVNFSEYLASQAGVPGLRSLNGFPEQGQPPGNFPPGAAPTFEGQNSYTDLVVNIDGQTNFGGCTINGYSFPTVATLVEAARGNLENDAVYRQSQAVTSCSVSPRSGYQTAYQSAVLAKLEPMSDAQQASLAFTNILNTDTDCHFGFNAFDDTIGQTPSDYETWNNIDSWAPYGSINQYPLPLVALNPGATTTNYSSVNTEISSCVSMGSTNIGASIDAAVQDMKVHARPGAVKAIILFTDGEPTVPSGPLDSDPLQNARKAAVEAKNAGIAVYTIGLAQNTAIIPAETAILNDTDSNPNSGGIAAIAGNGGTFNLVTNSSQLRAEFEKIARRLVQLIQEGQV